MGTELPTKVMLGQTLVLIQMTFLNNLRKVGRLVLSRTSCFFQYSYISSLFVCFLLSLFTSIFLRLSHIILYFPISSLPLFYLFPVFILSFSRLFQL
jgi:hypothetical protein